MNSVRMVTTVPVSVKDLNPVNPSTGSLSEEDLIARAQAGDKEAFGVLVERHMKRAYYTALALTGSHEDALDLSQEAFVRAYQAIGRFKIGTARFFTWYYRILMNLYLNSLRSRKRKHRMLKRYTRYLERRRQQEVTTQEAAEKHAVQERVWNALMQLSPHDRVLLVLKDFRGLTYQEIARLFDVPPGTIMSRIFHARKRLKKILEKPK